MMEELLPPGVVVAERWGDDESAFLLPEEQALVAKAVGKRAREFTTARSCARQALGKLGFPPVPILRGSKGEPLWPRSAVGSITHCDGYRAAAVAMQTRLSAIGIDAEIHDALPPEVMESLCIAEGAARLRLASDQLHWDRILFSAKESVYKAWFPLTQRWLGFEEVAITVDRAEGTFRVRPLVTLPMDFDQALRQFAGRFLVRNGVVLTAVVLPRIT
jgi:4'-phosphopantetheinyl transferase EntD